jgi:argininosuccinate lyase
MKGQPLAYNKDNQEDKEPLFDAADTVIDTLAIFAELVPGISVHAGRMREAATRGYSTATDLADYLVRLGLPFREAHEAVALTVRAAVDSGRDLTDLQLDEIRQFAPKVAHLISTDVFVVLALEGSIHSRQHLGGTAPAQVRAAIAKARIRLAEAG